MSGMDRLTDEAPLSERLRAHCIGQPAIVAWPHRILHEAAIVVQAAEDVAHGRGMFGVDAKADLEWVMGVLGDALAHRRASQAAPAPSDGLREAWIAGRDAAAAEAFYACGCKDSIEALTPPDALTTAPAQEGPNPNWPPQCCTAWDDCKIDGICHDPEYCSSVGPNARNYEDQADD